MPWFEGAHQTAAIHDVAVEERGRVRYLGLSKAGQHTSPPSSHAPRTTCQHICAQRARSETGHTCRVNRLVRIIRHVGLGVGSVGLHDLRTAQVHVAELLTVAKVAVVLDLGHVLLERTRNLRINRAEHVP